MARILYPLRRNRSLLLIFFSVFLIAFLILFSLLYFWIKKPYPLPHRPKVCHHGTEPWCIQYRIKGKDQQAFSSHPSISSSSSFSFSSSAPSSASVSIQYASKKSNNISSCAASLHLLLEDVPSSSSSSSSSSFTHARQSQNSSNQGLQDDPFQVNQWLHKMDQYPKPICDWIRRSCMVHGHRHCHPGVSSPIVSKDIVLANNNNNNNNNNNIIIINIDIDNSSTIQAEDNPDHERFFVLDLPSNFHGFNNELIRLLNGVVLARSLNRTLLFDHDKFFQYFRHDEFVRRLHVKTQHLPRYKHQQQWQPHFNAALLVHGHPISDLITLLSSPIYATIHKLYIGQDIYWLCLDDPQHEIDFFNALIPTPAYQTITIHVLQNLLNLFPYQYVAVHRRHFEGGCPRLVEYFYKNASAVLHMCDIQPERVHDILAHYNIPATTPIFVASDHQDYEGDKRWKYLARFLPGDPILTSSCINPAILDLMILIHAKIVIGNVVSTFAATVANMRMARITQAGIVCDDDINVLTWPQTPRSSPLYWLSKRTKFFCKNYKL